MRLLLALGALLLLALLTPNRGTGVNEEPRHASKGTHDAGLGRGAPAPVPRPTHASRSRTATLPRSSPRGSRLSVTCYVATGHRTASGSWPRPGMAAGNRWPFGTRLRVEHIGVVTITDRIGWGSQLDLFMTSRAACVRFGRHRLRVAVLP